MLTGSDIFNVRAGDSYGFTWLDYGVIDFDYVGPDNYCEDPQIFDVGQQANLVGNRHGKRDYSIRMLFKECEERVVTEVPTPTPTKASTEAPTEPPIPKCSKYVV